MPERSERFKARQALLREKRAGAGIAPLGHAELVRQHEESECDHDRLNKDSADRQAYYNLETDIAVDDAEVEVLLAEIQGKLDSRHIDEILDSAMQMVLQNIGVKFGVGGAITREFADTVKYRRDDYVTSTVKKSMDERRSGSETDAYTGTSMEHPEADHTVSIKEFHESTGWWLTADQKRKFAADMRNLAPVDRSTNRSKGSKPLPDFERENHENTSPGQDRVDRRRTRHVKGRSREAVTDHQATAWDKAKFVSLKGASSGVRMGLQQAMGVVLHELTVALFEEAKDIYRQGGSASGDSFWEVLGRRALRILTRVKDKWREVFTAFGEGLISGFLSLVVEVILKALKGIAVRTGRLIRESVHSLMKANRLLLFPPENMSFSEAAHEATKILSGCVIVGLGFGAEEAAKQLLSSMMGPVFADLVASVLLGVVTGLGAAFAAYCLDKLDIFGAHEKIFREGVFEELRARRGTALDEMDEVLDFFHAPILPNPSQH